MVPTSWKKSSASTKVKMRSFCVLNYVGGADLCRFPIFFCENYTFLAEKSGHASRF